MKLKDLKKALAPILNLCHKRITFEVEGLEFTLRLLREEEERYVFEYARDSIADADKESEANGKEPLGKTTGYFDSFRRGVLSYAICKIGDMDFEGQETIFDEDLNADIPTSDALKDILINFTRPLLEKLHIKYGELLEEAELDAESAIKLNTVRTEKLIELYKEKLDYLTATLNAQKDTESMQRNRVIESSTIVSQVVRQENLDALPQNSTVRNTILDLPDEGVAEITTQTESVDEWNAEGDLLEDVSEIEFTPSATSAARPIRMPAYPPSSNPPPPPRPQTQPTAQEQFLEDSSFIHDEDLEVAAHREHLRLQQQRAQRQQAVVPHALAAQTQKEVARPSFSPAGELDSVPVYAREKYVHDLRSKPGQPASKIQAQPADKPLHSNPRFNPHSKG